jgi:hypothetical protein
MEMMQICLPCFLIFRGDGSFASLYDVFQYNVDVFVKHDLLNNGTRILNTGTTTAV